jgi:hypothetical protein
MADHPLDLYPRVQDLLERWEQQTPPPVDQEPERDPTPEPAPDRARSPR